MHLSDICEHVQHLRVPAAVRGLNLRCCLLSKFLKSKFSHEAIQLGETLLFCVSETLQELNERFAFTHPLASAHMEKKQVNCQPCYSSFLIGVQFLDLSFQNLKLPFYH